MIINNQRLSSRLVAAAQEDSIKAFYASSDGEFQVKEGARSVSFLCSWTPGRFRYADILVDDDSIYSHPVYGPIVELDDPNERIYFTEDDTLGVATLTIKDVTMSDRHWFACLVSRLGPTEPTYLNVVDPDTSSPPPPSPPTRPFTTEVKTFYASSDGEFLVKEGATSVSFSCSWTPGRFRYGDILVDAASIYSHPVYSPIVVLEDPNERIYFTQDETLGVATLTIKDVTMSDRHWFACSVSRLGSTEPTYLDVIDPDPEPTTSSLPPPSTPTSPPPTMPTTTTTTTTTTKTTTKPVTVRAKTFYASSDGEFLVKEGARSVSFLCSWTPGRFKYADILVDDDSIYSHPVYGPIVELEDPNERIYFTQDDTLGVATLTIKDVSMSDRHWFACAVSRLGPTEPIYLNVVVPDPEPTTSPTTYPPHTTEINPVTTSDDSIVTFNPTTDWVPRPTEEGENEIEVEFGGLKVDIDLEELIQKWSF